MNLTAAIYRDADKARKHLEKLHWPEGPVCPRCGSGERITLLKGKSTRPGVHKCNACEKPFTVTVGTIFEDSKIPLNKWLLAFAMVNGSKKGISAHQLHRQLGITYKSAWFMAHRIREAMREGNLGPLGGNGKIVEADEAYYGKATDQSLSAQRKGRPLLIEGRLKLDQWEDKQTNQKRSRLGVVLESFSFIDSKGGGDSGGGEMPRSRATSNAPAAAPADSGEPEDDDDVPF